MVNPILLIALPLGAAFLLPLVGRIGLPAARNFHLAVLAFCLALTAYWFGHLGLYATEAIDIETGGWAPPWGILLRLGGPEAGLIALADATALIGALYINARDREGGGVRSLVIQLMIVLGAHGLILTRDLFNMFVFIEIVAIGAYSIILHGKEGPALEAGLKYILVGSVASVLILLATGLLYRFTGTLYIDQMAERIGSVGVVGVCLTQILLLVGFLTELKLFPVNGPAIDLYEGADPGVMALIVGTVLNAVFFAFTKVFVLYQAELCHSVVMWAGMGTYLISNLLATRQTRVRRLLGYSSSGQMGLMVFLWALVADHPMMLGAVALLLLNHTVAKAGLLWIVGLYKAETVDGWTGALRSRPFMALSLIVLVLSISGLPPFPGFWGKWDALVIMSQDPDAWRWIAPLLVGALLEWVFYFGWVRKLFENEEAEAGLVEHEKIEPWVAQSAAAVSLVIGLAILYVRVLAPYADLLPAVGLIVFGIVMVLLRGLPWRTQGVLVLAAFVVASIGLFGVAAPTHPLSWLFLGITLLGGLVIGFAALSYTDRGRNYWGFFAILAGSLVLLVQSVGTVRPESLLLFFLAWEIMTWTSWLLMGEGRQSANAGYVYMLFSAGAGMLILGGLMVAGGSATELAALVGAKAAMAWTLIVLGAAVKLGSWGAHIWARDAYSESPDDFTPYLSAVVSKAPVFALVVLVASIHMDGIVTGIGTLNPAHVLAWIGGITALAMALMAALQEDAKKLLAYSSVGQVAYIVCGFAVMTPLGWTAALYLTVNHFLFKALLFLAIAGVIYRTGTRTLYELGGLIKKMPFTYGSVLIGIIAVSGVPPLSGFVGKWLIYEAMVDRGWYLLTGVTMFATMVAFLYLYRIIHTVFLGQLKRQHREVREAPWPTIVAQYVLIALIMVLSVWPQVLLEPVSTAVAGLGLEGGALTFGAMGHMETPVGYANPLLTMIIVIVTFAILLGALLLLAPRPKWVNQLDMVYAAEVPPPAEEIHYAWAMFRPYARAFGPFLAPRVTRFWTGVAETVGAVTEVGRRFYTGNAQTYLLYSVALIVILASIGGGK